MRVTPSSCIDALPVELLSFIFLLATHSATDPENIIPFASDSVKIPLVFSAVNRHWRAVALNTSALWTSLCATVGSIEVNKETQSSFNTTHLSSYLHLSRRQPVDILIDARDQNWDFSEPEIPSSYEYSTYVPPFSVAHMNTVMSLVLSHLPRWRSFVVLTDTWAPMHAVLLSLNTRLITSKAPLLESLILMRCNEYVSLSPEFQPHTLKYPAFLQFDDRQKIDLDVTFPRLRQFSLRGVHADWSYLPTVVQNSSLTTFEMTSHSLDVRPSLHDFYSSLSTMNHLRKLVIHGSGPLSLESFLDEINIPDSYYHAVSFPNLEELVLGYHSAMDGINFFEMVDIPNIKKLTLEDATYPGDIDDVDAGFMLIYLSEGVVPQRVGNLTVYTFIGGQSHPMKQELSPDRRERANTTESDSPKDDEELLQHRSPLAHLEALTLKRVKAHSASFRCLFYELKCLKELELCSTSMDPVEALIPGSFPFHTKGGACPCPQLSSLTLRNIDSHGHSVSDLDHFISSIDSSRDKLGATQVGQIDIFLSCARETEWQIQQELPNFTPLDHPSESTPRVKVIGSDEYEFEYDSDRDNEYEEDAFQPGGAFNDPLFDAYYGSRISAL